MKNTRKKSTGTGANHRFLLFFGTGSILDISGTGFPFRRSRQKKNDDADMLAGDFKSVGEYLNTSFIAELNEVKDPEIHEFIKREIA